MFLNRGFTIKVRYAKRSLTRFNNGIKFVIHFDLKEISQKYYRVG